LENEMRKKMFVKLYYSLLDWAWINNPNTLVVFIHLLLNANRKNKPYKNGVICKGEVLASYDFLAEKTGLSVQKVRTAINNLLETKDISKRKIGCVNVFSINCWDKMENSFVDYNSISYDDNYNTQQTKDEEITSQNQKINNKKTKNQQTDNKLSTTPIYCKNEENEENEIMKKCESEKITHARGKLHNVFISQDDYDEFRKEFPYIAEQTIDQLSEKIATGDPKYQSGHIGHLYVFARNFRQEKKFEEYKKPSYDIELAMQKAKKVDPTKTKRGK